MLKVLGFRKQVSNQIKPLLGINSGPTPFGKGEPDFANVSRQYQQLGIESIRTEDLSNGSFDVMYFFPDRQADPGDPLSYEWRQTDENFRDIIDLGMDPFVRLGQSWRNMVSWGAYGLNEPTGYPGYGPFWSGERPLSTTMLDKGVKIFEKLLERYTDEDLWGFNPLEHGYFEIWNEPQIIGINTEMQGVDSPTPYNKSEFEYTEEFPSYSWDGTPEEFYEFFADTAIRLKELHPKVKIGGPGIHNVGLGLPSTAESEYMNTIGLEWTENFLRYLKERDVELDFLSWHYYGSDPQDYIAMHDKAHKLLVEFGYGDTEQIVSEWNTSFDSGNASTPLGAAQASAIWIALQNDAPSVANAHFYRGADGPFVPDGNGFPIWIENEGSSPFQNNFGDYGVGLMTSDASFKASAYAYQSWADLTRRENVDLDSFYSSQPGENGLYVLGGLQSGEKGSDLRVLSTYLPVDPDDPQEIVVDTKAMAKQFGLAPSSVQIRTLPGAFGGFSEVDPDDDGTYVLPSNELVSIQFESQDFEADVLTNWAPGPGSFDDENLYVSVLEGDQLVGDLAANQYATWTLHEGDDSDLFSLDSKTGRLLFEFAPDFERPGDADKNNIYQLAVSAVSDHETCVQNIYVRVVDNMKQEWSGLLLDNSFF